MNRCGYSLPVAFSRLISIGLICIAAISHSTAMAAGQRSAADALDAGYSALKLFLEDEQHLTAIRRVKMVLSFRGISEPSKTLIDEIADSADQALEELEELATLKPAIVFVDFSDDSIGKATLDSLRIATAKEFLFETGDFEKNLLLSQSQILRVISHLAKQLGKKEPSPKRRDWLENLAARYDNYYRQVYALITVTTERGA